MEADLARYYPGVDLRDRWRVEHGRRALSLRRIAVLLRHLPPESVLATLSRDGAPPWGLTEVLLAQVWQAASRSKKPHPALDKAVKSVEKAARLTPERKAAVVRARARARAREARLAAKRR